MLLTKNDNNAFEFVKVIMHTIVNPDKVKTVFGSRHNYVSTT